MPKIFFPSSRPKFVNTKKVISSLRNISVLLMKKKHNIDKIYLFGSFATGEAGVRSDADILVVLKEDKRRIFERMDEFILKFSDAPVPVDVLTYTREELNKMINEGNRFIQRILQEAVLLGQRPIT